jgi:hypothetical protein
VVINSKFILASRQTPAGKFNRASAGKATPETAKEPRLPENVSQLRQKLGQKAKQEPKDLLEEGASLHFLGYTFRYDRDRKYLNVFPSRKAVQREREKLHEMTNRRQCHKPIPVLIGELNRQLKGWMNYFSFGYPSSTYCEIER